MTDREKYAFLSGVQAGAILRNMPGWDKAKINAYINGLAAQWAIDGSGVIAMTNEIQTAIKEPPVIVVKN